MGWWSHAVAYRICFSSFLFSWIVGQNQFESIPVSALIISSRSSAPGMLWMPFLIFGRHRILSSTIFASLLHSISYSLKLFWALGAQGPFLKVRSSFSDSTRHMFSSKDFQGAQMVQKQCSQNGPEIMYIYLYMYIHVYTYIYIYMCIHTWIFM